MCRLRALWSPRLWRGRWMPQRRSSESEMETIDESGPTEKSGVPDERLAAAVDANLFPGLASDPAHVEPIAGSNVQRLGRYTVLRELGRGAMGIVFACYDENLERKVAVKLLLTRSPEEKDHLRLEREARGLARLSHPNVVQIHELGEHHGQLFLAMEFIVGDTLRGWLQGDRAWRDTVEVLRQAGAGLAAAHAAGLVHRDFKPDNVMVGTDQRVRVLDFGLVRPISAAAPRGLDLDARVGPDPALTRAGAVMGTPAYMAPEGLDGEPASETSDQFSFCVAAFEALFGGRPFAGTTIATLMTSVEAGVPTAVPDDSPVPRRLRAAIVRGLSADPTARWSDMSALLAEFDHALDVGRRSRRVAWTLGTLGPIVGAVALVASGGDAESKLCSFDASALFGTWDEAGRGALRSAFAMRGASDVEASVQAVDETLTAWGERWLAGQRRACEATRVVGNQSEAALDLRTNCFERQRREARALVELLTAPDGSGVTHAGELLERLPDTGICGDPRLAETSHPLPEDPKRREGILEVYGLLERARALGDTTRVAEADALVEQIGARAAHLDHVPLSVQAAAVIGERALWRHRVDEGVPIVREATAAAEIAGLDETSATLRTLVAVHVVGQWGSTELQAMVLEEAQTSVARIGRSADPRLMRLDFARGALLFDSGDFEGALRACRQGMARAQEQGPYDAVGRAQRQLGNILVELGRFGEAEQAYLDARASFERAWGSSSTWSGADIDLHLGLLELRRGRFDEAKRHLQVAREGLAQLVDPGDSDLDLLELSEAKLALTRGDLKRAAQGAERVLDIGADDLRRAEAWEMLGVIRFYQRDMSASLDAYRRALPYHLATRGSDHPTVGMNYSNTGETLVALGDHAGAQTAFADALTILERALPAEHLDLALPYKGRAQSRLALGEPELAVVDLERALSLHVRTPAEPLERADVEFTLAQALALTGAQRRARELAVTAQQRLAELGQVERAATIDSWILEHDDRPRPPRTNQP